jgi:hypothetical protein
MPHSGAPITTIIAIAVREGIMPSSVSCSYWTPAEADHLCKVDFTCVEQWSACHLCVDI